ncbi:MAG: type II toxin-antitoxin system prevent-host-death family antitoxin [Caldilineaceae bacterium]
MQSRQTSAVIRSIQEEGDVVYITQHGRPTVVLLDYEQCKEALSAQAQPEGWPGRLLRTNLWRTGR